MESEGTVSVEELQRLLKRLDMWDQNRGSVQRLSQCTSSFFVLLFQRVFNAELLGLATGPGLDNEKKLINIRQVLAGVDEMVDSPGTDHIDPEEILMGDETHISRLLRIFIAVVDWEDSNASADGSRPLPAAHAPYVDTWMQDLVIPAPRPASAAVVRRGSADLSERAARVVSRSREAASMTHSDAAAAAKDLARLHRSLPRCADGLAASRIDAAARDAKIERLRAQRFVLNTHSDALRVLVSRESEAELRHRRDARQRLQAERRDERDLKAAARDADERLREIYADAVHSAANARPARSVCNVNKRLASWVRMGERKALAADLVVEDAARRRRRQQTRSVDTYVGALQSWQSQNRLF